MITRAIALLLVGAGVPAHAPAQQARPPVLSEMPRQYIPADSLSPEELVLQWEAEMSRPISPERPARTSGRGDGIARALKSYRTDSGRAAAVRDELEKVVFRASDGEVRCHAILYLVSGYRADSPEDRSEAADTRELARRLERIYGELRARGSIPSSCVFVALVSLGGSGRFHALTWLEPLITQEAEAQAYPKEALEAMRAAANLGPPGRALVALLRERDQIKEPEARLFSGVWSGAVVPRPRGG